MHLFNDKEYVVCMREDNYFLAFNALFNKYSRPLYAFVLSITRDSFSAEEITQIVFIKVWEKRSTLDESFSFKSFLFSIAYNETISWLRKEKSEKRRANGYGSNSEGVSYETEHVVEYTDLQQIVANLVEAMPERRREIYRLSREEGLTNKEIAQNLHISVKTVENQMTSALKYLKENLLKYDVLALMVCLSGFY